MSVLAAFAPCGRCAVTTSTEAAADETPAARGSKEVYNRVWFKVYGADLLTDPRIALMTDAQFRVWIGILALANDTLTPGFVTFETPGIALMLRRPEAEVEDCISRFGEDKLIRSTIGGLEIVNGHRFYGGTGLSYGRSAEGAAARKRAQRARASLSPRDHGHTDLWCDTCAENENLELEDRSVELNQTVLSCGVAADRDRARSATVPLASSRAAERAPILDIT